MNYTLPRPAARRAPLEGMRIFIGYDSKEPVTFSVLAHSILRHSSVPVLITPLSLTSLGFAYKRARGPLESTEFSMTRFLVPFLSGYEGHSVFLDSDMLCQTDIWELQMYAVAYADKAVQCCQHDYIPKGGKKFLGQTQTAYPRKNWSSMMLFNNELCKKLTPEYVNKASGLELHRFQWLEDSAIGALPLEWNHLVGEYEPNSKAKILHYTLGAPCFKQYENCDNADLWHKEYALMTVPLGTL
jgi:hypothetical protein